MGHVVFAPKQMTPEQLLRGVRSMYTEFYGLPSTTKRIMQNLPRGLYPFFVVFARNIVAMGNARRLYSREKTDQYQKIRTSTRL